MNEDIVVEVRNKTVMGELCKLERSQEVLKLLAVALPERLIDSIKSLGKKYDVEKIILFGSRARGDHQRTSDIDLAVYPLANFINEGSMTSEFEDLDTLLKIDVIFVTSDTDDRLIKNIEKEGVILYE